MWGKLPNAIHLGRRLAMTPEIDCHIADRGYGRSHAILGASSVRSAAPLTRSHLSTISEIVRPQWQSPGSHPLGPRELSTSSVPSTPPIVRAHAIRTRATTTTTTHMQDAFGVWPRQSTSVSRRNMPLRWLRRPSASDRVARKRLEWTLDTWERRRFWS